ncbi:hypothetical protein ACHHYP_06738, partial [Achlya hypogyna]
MIKQCLALKSTIIAVSFSDTIYQTSRVNDVQWESLEAVDLFLRVPAQISTIVGASKVCSVSLAYGANHKMIKHCNANLDHANPVIADASEKMLAKLVGHAAGLNCEAASITKFLDPRCARDTTKPEFQAERQVIEKVMAVPRYVGVNLPDDDVLPSGKGDELNLLGVSATNDVTFDNNEIDRYAALPQVDKDADLLEWWRSHKLVYPVLYKIAMDYLSIPVTSVPSKRANSAAKSVFEGRDNLGDNMFKAQMCAQSWLQLAKALDFPLPADYLQALDD